MACGSWLGSTRYLVQRPKVPCSCRHVEMPARARQDDTHTPTPGDAITASMWWPLSESLLSLLESLPLISRIVASLGWAFAGSHRSPRARVGAGYVMSGISPCSSLCCSARENYLHSFMRVRRVWFLHLDVRTWLEAWEAFHQPPSLRQPRRTKASTHPSFQGTPVATASGRHGDEMGWRCGRCWCWRRPPTD